MLVVGIEREASRVVEVEVQKIASTGGIHLVINTAPGAICTFLGSYLPLCTISIVFPLFCKKNVIFIITLKPEWDPRWPKVSINGQINT